MLKHSDGSWESPLTVEVDESASLPSLVFQRAAERPEQIVAERRTGVGQWSKVSAAELGGHMMDLARGMYGLGVRRGDHVAILASTSYEWATLDLAILALGAVTVPIYESDSSTQISHILRDAKVVLVVTQTVQQSELVQSVRPRSVREILSLDRGGIRTLSHLGHNVAATVIEEATTATKLTDAATVIYTSGTTGVPKGVVLTHGNFVLSLMQAYDILPELIDDSQSRTLLFLPVAHVLARFVMHAILVGKGRLGFCPDTRTLLQDIETFRPTMMLAVPRVLEKVYNSAAAKAGSGFKANLFAWSAEQSRLMSEATAYPRAAKPAKESRRKKDSDADSVVEDQPAPGTKLTSRGPGLTLRLSHQVADSLVLRKVKKILGPNLHTIICGGAPLSSDLANFYRGLGITLLQGYGLSETTGPITVERPDDNPPESVGYLWPGNSMKIAEDDELLLKGVSITPGYHNLPKVTAETFRDGWFHTGDLGSIDDDGRLRITGRKKEIIVTAGGKNVSPEVLEHSLATHPLIGHVIVIGDNRPYIGALVTLDSEMLPLWLRNKGVAEVPPHTAATLSEVKDSLARAITKANHAVSRAESIRRYRLVDAEFTVENGYLTPSLKLKRHKVLKDYAADIELLYGLSAADLAGVGGSIDTNPPDSSKK